MTELQRNIYTMRAERVKTDCLDVWSQEMQGAINPVLDILDQYMKRLEMGKQMPTNTEGYTTRSYLTVLQKKWQKDIRQMVAQVEGKFHISEVTFALFFDKKR